MPDLMRTLDGALIKPGLVVWDYDLRVAVVDERQFEVTEILRNGGKHTGYLGEYWDGWFNCRRPGQPAGTRGGSFNGERMWVNHPSTGVPAAEVGVALSAEDVLARLKEEYRTDEFVLRDGQEQEELAAGSLVITCEGVTWVERTARELNDRQCGWFAEPVNACTLALFPGNDERGL